MEVQIRLKAFEFIESLSILHGDMIPAGDLRKGFLFGGERVHVLGPQGIFKPKQMSLPLSITTAPPHPERPRPYDDELTASGELRYRYRGTDPSHHENIGLRNAMKDSVPLIYFHGVVKGQYVATCPVFVVGDDPAGLTFTVQVDDIATLKRDTSLQVAEGDSAARRTYITRTVVQRLHQTGFRERVLGAYRRRCAICRLRHRQLLDAAHIIPDSDPRGMPTVSNGLALCKLHHAAYDRNFLGIRPDLVIEIREALLNEKDGPMLIHGLKACHGQALAIVPRATQQRPNRDFLEERYRIFRNAS